MVIPAKDFLELLEPAIKEAEVDAMSACNGEDLKQINAMRQQVLAQNGIQQGQAVNWGGLGLAADTGFGGGLNQQANGTIDPRLVTPEQYESQRMIEAGNVFNDAFQHKGYSTGIAVRTPKKMVEFYRINEKEIYFDSKEPLDELRIEVAEWLNN